MKILSAMFYAGSIVALGTVAAAPACSSGEEWEAQAAATSGGGTSSSSGATGGGDGGASVVAHECSEDSDCDKKLPKTNPAGCAEAKCDILLSTCKFVAKDADGDGHLAKDCTIGSGNVEVGDDCDDTNANRYPGNWDGPPGEGLPDHCDKVDNDCDGPSDNSTLSSGGTCTCTPGEQNSCSAYDNGGTIIWPTGTPTGECSYGTTICQPNGQWGPCLGAVGPSVEACNNVDDDCDGIVDNDFTWNGLSLGQACSSVEPGACKTDGIVVCGGPNLATCNAIPGPKDAQFHTTPSANGSWDYNCDGGEEKEYSLDPSVANCSYPGHIGLCGGFAINTCSGMHWFGCGAADDCGQPIWGFLCTWTAIGGGWCQGGFGGQGSAQQMTIQACR